MSFWKNIFGGASLSKMTHLEQAAKDGDRDRVQGLLRICNDPSIIQRAIKLANKWKWHAVSKDLQEALEKLLIKDQIQPTQKSPAGQVRYRGLIFDTSGEYDFVCDDKKIVRGIWYRDPESIKNSARNRMVVATARAFPQIM